MSDELFLIDNATDELKWSPANELIFETPKVRFGSQGGCLSYAGKRIFYDENCNTEWNAGDRFLDEGATIGHYDKIHIETLTLCPQNGTEGIAMHGFLEIVGVLTCVVLSIKLVTSFKATKERVLKLLRSIETRLES